LRLKIIDAEFYLQLQKQGPSRSYNEIIQDAFRTFPTDKRFKERVSDEKLTRLLNAFALVYEGEDCNFSYVQGMNVLAAPFLYVMSEVEAFYAFKRFITKMCPTYVIKKNMKGVYAGCELVDRLLQFVDAELFDSLSQQQQQGFSINGRMWAFKYLCSLGAAQTPLTEVIKLWDFFFAFGFHLCVICIVAQVILIREKILKDSNKFCIFELLTFLG
jgi:cell cycle arrest protein BUB2